MHIHNCLSFAVCYIGSATVDDESFAALHGKASLETKNVTSSIGADIQNISVNIDVDVDETENEFGDSPSASKLRYHNTGK